MTTLGIIGAGQIGSQLARLAVRSGLDVVIANSRGPETLSDLVTELGERARAGTRDEAARAGDMVVVTIPLSAIDTLPAALLEGKIVIDTNNYYPERDGRIPVLDEEVTTTSELLQAKLPGSHVVKAFNHIGARFLTAHSLPAGAARRRALVVAGDDEMAKQRVSDLIDAFGFDVLDVGPLAEGWRIQRDTPGYADRFGLDELRARVAQAKRYRDM